MNGVHPRGNARPGKTAKQTYTHLDEALGFSHRAWRGSPDAEDDSPPKTPAGTAAMLRPPRVPGIIARHRGPLGRAGGRRGAALHERIDMAPSRTRPAAAAEPPAAKKPAAKKPAARKRAPHAEAAGDEAPAKAAPRKTAVPSEAVARKAAALGRKAAAPGKKAAAPGKKAAAAGKKAPSRKAAAKAPVSRAAAPRARGVPVAVDAAIEALDLGPVAKAAAYALKRAHPSVKFTSGRRGKADQARAMAGNVVKNRRWIEQTYAASPLCSTCQRWVDAHPQKTTQADVAAGLLAIFDAAGDAALGRFSKHLSGAAFDVQPVDGGEAIKRTIRTLAGLDKFLDNEGGLVRWHAQFNDSGV